MDDWPDPTTQRRLRAEGRAAAGLVRVPLHRRTWEGRAGNWSGAGRGTSLDFHDQRTYFPGDDPRHVNWQAYARTDQLTMKLFHEEVSPAVDLLCDVSRSMLAEPAKRERTFALLFLLVEGLRAAGSTLRATLISGLDAEEMPAAVWQSECVPAPARLGRGGCDLGLDRARLRPGALRLLISDTLFPAAPEPLVRSLTAARGRGIILAPWSVSEGEPGWDGPLDLIDSETGQRRIEHVGEPERGRYAGAYARHFELWRESCQRYGVAFARIACSGTLREALEPALATGALEALP